MSGRSGGPGRASSRLLWPLFPAERPGGAPGTGPGSLPGDQAGAKAARLAAALAAGLPVLPGAVVPAALARPALLAGVEQVRAGRPAAARRAVLTHPFDPELAAELRAAVAALGGQVIVRSSSPLEADPRWSGAFTSVAGVGCEDAAAAVRSCWSSALAPDPLARLTAAGMPPEALAMGALLQPQIRPDAGGTARVAGSDVLVEGVAGHPGPLLSGWAGGAMSRVPLRPGPPPGASPGREARPGRAAACGPQLPSLEALVGRDTVAAAARLAGQVLARLGDDTIEWARVGGTVYLLQLRRSAPAPPVPPAPRAGAGPVPGITPELAASRLWMPLLAAAVRAHGRSFPARPAAPGTAAGRLVACRPHQPPPAGWREAILLADRPVPALAPLLFGARGIIARAGGPGSHLAEVARSLGVPMVTGCDLTAVAGAGSAAGTWLAAVDGGTGEVALLRQ